MNPETEKQYEADQKRKQMIEDIYSLFEAARNTHKTGRGGAAFCICGAGNGGSNACRGLSILKQALLSKDENFRKQVLEAAGWD